MNADRAPSAAAAVTDRNPADASMPGSYGLGLRREVLEASSLAIVEVDLERRIRYANPAALQMLGAPDDYMGLSLADVFVNDASQKLIDEEIERRRAGLIGNYRITARRLSDQREIPIEITGLPITDSDGNVVAALGLFRSLELQALSDAIRQLNRPDQKPEELLRSLAETLRRAIPFARFSVSRMSSDFGHVNGFFEWPEADTARRKRWYALTEAMRQWYGTAESNVIPDLEKFLENPIWAPYRHEPAVEGLIEAGIKSVLRRDVHREGKIVGSITLMSCELDGFNKEQKDLFMAVPATSIVRQVTENFEKTRMAQRLDLLKSLNRCTAVVDACTQLSSRLVDIFGWSHVSIFRVDRTAGVLRLLAQHWDPEDPIRLPTRYEQALDKGILGRVVSTGKAQNVGNVHDDPDYIRSLRSGRVTSELCVPVMAEGETDVRWIINVEDTQGSAFASDELTALTEVAEEVGGLMQRIADHFFLTQCFEHASEAIFVTDAQLRLRRVNPAAAHLLGYKDAAKVQGNLCDYLVEPSACTRLAAPVGGDLGEFVIKRTGSTRPKSKAVPVSVFVSRRDFPEGLVGSIFIARETRAIRESVQSGILEKAAYSVAAETCTPLSAAMSELESISRQSPDGDAGLRRVLRQLGRVRHGYVRMAMFNPNARPASTNFTPLNLQAELEALARNVAASHCILVAPTTEGPPPVIQGDHFQVGFILETFLVAMLRYAPEDEAVSAAVSVGEKIVKVQLHGYLDAGIPMQRFDAAWIPSDADLAIAKPLIDEFMNNHHGSWLGSVNKNRKAEIELQFPLAGKS